MDKPSPQVALGTIFTAARIATRNTQQILSYTNELKALRPAVWAFPGRARGEAHARFVWNYLTACANFDRAMRR